MATATIETPVTETETTAPAAEPKPRYVHTQDRIAPLHRMGIEMPEGTTLDEGMRKAKMLNWDLHLRPLSTVTDDAGKDVLAIDKKYAIVQRDPRSRKKAFKALGLGVTEAYQIVHNETVAEFVRDLLDVDDHGLVLDSIGAYMGDAKCFVNLRLPEEVRIGGIDPIQQHLFVHWTHDGGGAVNIIGQGQRMFCTNQIKGILGSRTMPRFKITHVGNPTDRVAEARQALRVMWTGLDNFNAEAERWLAQAVTDDQFATIVDNLAPAIDPIEESAGAATKREAVREDLHSIWRAEHNGNVRGTAWGAINAWTEWGDWYMKRKDDGVRASQNVVSNNLDARRMLGVGVVKAVAGL